MTHPEIFGDIACMLKSKITHFSDTLSNLPPLSNPNLPLHAPMVGNDLMHLMHFPEALFFFLFLFFLRGWWWCCKILCANAASMLQKFRRIGHFFYNLILFLVLCFSLYLIKAKRVYILKELLYWQRIKYRDSND